MGAIAISRVIGPVPISVVIRERHTSNLGITEQPIETGAKVTDHAYVEPKRLTLEIGDQNAALTFAALVRLQESRVPFTIVSGLRVYKNMLIKSITADRDAKFANVLSGTVDLQEAIIVSTAYVSTEGEGNDAKSDGKPGGEKSTRAARPTTERAGDKVTGDRAAGTTMRGDIAEKSITGTENRSIMQRILQ